MGGGATRTLTLPAGGLARLRAVAASSAPREACGLLVGSGLEVDEIVPVPNVAAERHRFEMDPEALFAVLASDVEVVGVFHSHPGGPSKPSTTDRAEAVRAWLQVVVGAQGPRAFDPSRGWERLALDERT